MIWSDLKGMMRDLATNTKDAIIKIEATKALAMLEHLERLDDVVASLDGIEVALSKIATEIYDRP